ncbi:hypothetical protein PISMIDRAFT_679388 [Pisolithus microcarpus 441]|uniref:Uncharacterized protein n=1 Tax=Pisolithus microcarpus 441 TaxID=765257 RepID=A0A0C9ZBU5_9AGAM|nr:hypothetical protein PISMIDRAFT_679388 [Pisolithus microcarpus 441]
MATRSFTVSTASDTTKQNPCMYSILSTRPHEQVFMVKTSHQGTPKHSCCADNI